MFGLAKFREMVEFDPPSKAPSVPDTDRDEFVDSDDVATVFSVPFPFDVYATPFPVRFERLVMFCVVFTLNELPEYVSPVPAVVVAYDPTRPLYTAKLPLTRDGRLRAPENVDDAVENSPPVNPITVDVEL